MKLAKSGTWRQKVYLLETEFWSWNNKILGPDNAYRPRGQIFAFDVFPKVSLFSYLSNHFTPKRWRNK